MAQDKLQREIGATDLTGFNDGENIRSASEPNYLNTRPRANLTMAIASAHRFPIFQPSLIAPFCNLSGFENDSSSTRIVIL